MIDHICNRYETMGVPRLLSYLRRTYKGVFDKDKPTPKLDHIYLDANAMLYQIVEVTKDPIEIARQLVGVAESYSLVYQGKAHIYIDGAAHMAKLREQRVRRFMYEPVSAATISNVEPGMRLGQYDVEVGLPWTTAMFSPGTEMMRRIHEEILILIRGNDAIGSYSSYFEPAEGEHKIVDVIKLLPSGSSVGIIGKDADLLLIGMTLVEKGYKAYVIRHDDTRDGMEDGYRPEDPIWNIQCSLLRRHILASIKKDTIWDFIIATFIIGNDFLPPVPEMAHLYDVMPNIIKAMARLPSSLHTGDGINWSMFKRYVEILYDMVPPNLNWLGIQEKGETMGKEAFTQAYYDVISPFPVNRERLVDAYTRTMDWVYQYYQHGPTVASVAWQYPIHYAPSLGTLHLLLRDDIDIEWGEQEEPLKPHQALACILPPWLRSLLPEEVAKKMKGYDLYYPYSFDLMPVTEAPIVPIIPYDVAITI